MPATIAYYITAHGYGHGARSCDILTALHHAAPNSRIIVKTDLPLSFLHHRLPAAIEIQNGAFDTGLVQQDSVRSDIDASLEAIGRLYNQEDQLIEQESGYMAAEHVDVVVADIPAIPLAAAQRLGIPNVATGNFGWDWIYEEFAQENPRWQPFVERIRAAYRRTDLLLRQPFAEPMSAFPERIDLPLLARAGVNRRDLLAELTGAAPDKRWVLLSFTSLNMDHSALERLSKPADLELFTVEPLRWQNSTVHCISRSSASFADVLASVDCVVTKPGFGILSECIVNGKPIIYTERIHFREYGVLVDGIRRYCRHAHISNAELYAGRLEHALKSLDSAPPPTETMASGGAELAARIILERAAPSR